MGKKRSVQVRGGDSNVGGKVGRFISRIPKKKLVEGIVHIEATHNNTKIILTDKTGGVVLVSSPSLLGFSGKKKSTPFAAGEAAKVLADKATTIGLQSLDIVVKGVGSGRESVLRTLAGYGFAVQSIRDATPVPHNGPRRRKKRRV